MGASMADSNEFKGDLNRSIMKTKSTRHVRANRDNKTYQSNVVILARKRPYK